MLIFFAFCKWALVLDKKYKKFSQVICQMVFPAIYVLSGCDPTSALVGIAKGQMYNTVSSKEGGCKVSCCKRNNFGQPT